MINIKIIRYWKSRLSASDPGSIRLSYASKIVLTMTFTCLVMFHITQLGSHVNHLTPVIMACLVGMWANVFIIDNTTKAKKSTICLFDLSSAVSVSLAITFSIISYQVADIMLLITIFLAIYVKRFGIRYFSIGLVSSLLFYFSLMDIHDNNFSQLPWYYAAIFVGSTFAYIVNLFIKERPSKVLKGYMISYNIQTNLALNIITNIIQDSKSSARKVENLTRDIKILNVYMRTVVSQFKLVDPGEVWPGIQINELRLYVFDTTMLIETLAQAVEKLKDLHAMETSSVRDCLLKIVQFLRGLEVLSKEYDSSLLENVEKAIKTLRKELDLIKMKYPGFIQWLVLLRRVESITNHVIEGVKEIQQKRLDHLSSDSSQDKFTRERKKTMEKANVIEYINEKQIDKKPFLHPCTKKGLQASLVCGVAIVIGHYLSPAYPYWMALSAYVVILNTETIGHTAKKASHRLIGTFFGAIVGLIIAHLVAGKTCFMIIILVLSIFMSFYLISLSYGVFAFWITMLLAIALELLSVKDIEQVLILRIFDTMIGASLSAMAATFIFPSKTTDKVTSSMIGFISDLKEYVDVCLKKFTGTNTDQHLADKALNLDQKFQQIKNDADIIKRWPGNLSGSDMEIKLTVITAINYYTKRFVASGNREQRSNIDDNIKLTLDQIQIYFNKNIDILCQLLNKQLNRDINLLELMNDRVSIECSLDERGFENLKKPQFINGLDYVWNINQTIIALAITLDKTNGN